MSTETAVRTPSTVPASAAPARIVAFLACAAVLTSLTNSAIGALGALIAGPSPIGIGFPQPAVASVLGVLIGTGGWALIRRFSTQPARVLRYVVPLAVLVSFTPDLVVLVNGATVADVCTLLVMHVVVAVVATIALARVLPVS